LREEQQAREAEQEAEREAQRRAQEPAIREQQAKQELERKKADKKYQMALAQQEKLEQERGYKRIGFDDFALDGKELAATEAKVSIRGVYIKRGEVEMLFPSPMAAATAQETGNDMGIGILTDDAPRNIRKYFLACRNNPAAMGCPITVWAHASMCTRTSLLGSKNVPCLIVDDGWNIAR
jgi:hypothetical protein